MKYGSVALLGVTVLLLVIWGFVAGLPGIWGVLVSAAISGVFILATAGLVLASANTSPSTTGAIVFGGLLIKIAVLLPVLYGLSRLHFYDTWAFFTTTLVTLIVVIGAEVWGVITARVQTISRHI
nr:hypothetical protein [Corynebacterium caspium]